MQNGHPVVIFGLASGSGEEHGGLMLIYSEIAGRIVLKICRMVEGICKNVLAKEHFGSINVNQGQIGEPQVPLLRHRDYLETPNWACRVWWTEIKERKKGMLS